MKTVVIVGGGSGGMSTANHLAYKLRDNIKNREVKVVLFDGSGQHYYQPGFLEIPFDMMAPASTYRPMLRLAAEGVTIIQEFVTEVDLKNSVVKSEKQKINYDYIVIATGARYDYDSIPGLREGTDNFYSLENAISLKKKLNSFKGGKIVVGVSSMPYKCTPAPLEAVFMLNDYFTRRGMRDKVEIEYTYPMPMAFPNKEISDISLKMFEEKGIKSSLGFQLKSVDANARVLISQNGEKISYDLALIVPPHKGNKLMENSEVVDKMVGCAHSTATAPYYNYRFHNITITHPLSGIKWTSI